ncbi:MAG: hypothetical protein HRU03_09280 [Nanoarchaeales archaeon]|nr:hypothetical protein [Nanoarchaeales archaeon]
MKLNILEEIGLTKSESKVYMSLLELGDTKRAEIINKSQVASSKIYEILNKLILKGLATTYIKNKIKYFKPVNPNQLITYLDEKKEKINQIETETKKALPELLKLYTSSEQKKEVELLIGFKSLQEVFREQVEELKENDTCYILAETHEINNTTNLFFSQIHLQREAKKIKSKMLYNISQKKIVNKFFSSKKYPLTQTKYIEHESSIAINVYNNKTIIIIFGIEISIIKITSQEAANSFLEYFKVFWKTAKI